MMALLFYNDLLNVLYPQIDALLGINALLTLTQLRQHGIG